MLGVLHFAFVHDASASNPAKRTLVRPSQTAVAYAKRAVQGFGMQMWLTNQMCFGLQAWDLGGPPLPQDPQFGLQYPIDRPIEHLFGAGVWFGGLVDGVRRVTEGYEGETAEKYFRPDPNHPLRERIWVTSTASVGEPNMRGWDDDGDGKIDEDDLDGLDNDGDWVAATDDVGIDGIPDSLETGCKGGYAAATNPDPAYDNYRPIVRDSCHPNPPGSYSTYRLMNDKDLYTEKNGIPDHGEPHVDEDYGAVSDRDLSCTATDTVPASGHTPMGIKVIQKSYAWSDASREAILPVEYSFVNIGRNVIQSPYIAMFADADVGPTNVFGYYQHDFSCYIDSLKTAYTQNAIDPGSTPFGVTILGASKPLDQMGVVFRWYDFSGLNPGALDTARYGWMSGEGFPADPIQSCQSPASASDTKFLLSAGPFDQFNPGDTIRISFAFVSGESLWDGANSLAGNARKILQQYSPTGVQDHTRELPLRVSLEQNYPNPFNPATTISYALPGAAHATLIITNVLGEEVARLVDADQMPGNHQVVWEASGISSGVYFSRLLVGSSVAIKKLLLLR
jgi:hypothetical protein